jgi:hypothetical protein
MLDINTQREYEILVREWADDAWTAANEDREHLSDEELAELEPVSEFDAVWDYLGSDGIIYTYDALRILLHSNNCDAWTETGGKEVLPENTDEIFCHMATWAIFRDMVEYLEGR